MNAGVQRPVACGCPARADHGFGARVLDDGQVQFRLWAPGCTQVALELELDGRPPLAMTALDGGWFEARTDAAPGARYRYRVAADLAVPDPASRLQAGDVHEASVVVGPGDYVWQYPDWRGRPWPQMVILEVHAGVCGGFDGVRAQLPRWAEAGITAIELMPIADFPGRRNWGYDGVLPYAPDTAYGTPAQLRALIDAAHGLGLCVYLDVVYNHFGPEGNYLHAYAPQFFVADAQSPWGATIDFSQPAVRAFFTGNALYWLLDYRFDGLRFDAVHAIPDPGWLDEMAAAVRAATPGRHVHLMLENEHNTASHLDGDFDAQWNDDAHNALHVLLTGEREGYYANYAGRAGELFVRCLGEGFGWQGEPSPGHDGRPRGTPSAHLPASAFVFFLQNHDQIGNRALGERLLALCAQAGRLEAWRAALAVQLLCPQVPLLFMGDELGSTTPFLFFTDFHDELAEAVREGRRREFAQFAAFADPERRAAIPDPNAGTTFESSRPQPGDPEDAARVATLLHLRNTLLAPRLAGTRALGSAALGPAALRARWRLGDGTMLTIYTNLADMPVELDFVPPAGSLLYESRDGAAAALARDDLAAAATTVWLSAGTVPDSP